ncbi:RDD family protein [Limnochorda pilosa]|uniref:RDD domain-containing protein n=1 Tax=Limnochorda pilosa TaxID=1555112 RepID=A0A0K2SQA8_LIMPI|nr:RDD family protein [Limnochorda pilosa]BAS29313.1 hypothetical protein LIP_3501 [Limnochorda pilosa]
MHDELDPSERERTHGPRSRGLDDPPKADLIRRFVAAVLDGVVAGVLNLAIPLLGGLLGAAYILFKDALPYEVTRNRAYANQSIGKRAAGLEVALLEGHGPMSWGLSAQRNWPLAIGAVLGAIPLAGWVLGPVLGSLIGLVEALLIVIDPDGRRLGDRMAETQVVPATRRRMVA